MEKITINGKKYNLKYTIRALFIFEQITKKSFKVESMLDNYIFLYSMILANNKDKVLEWDEFIDAMDNDPQLLDKMNQVLANNQKKNELFDEGEKDGGEEKKS